MNLSKIQRDYYYNKLYKKTNDLDLCIEAGYFEDNLDEIPYDLNCLTTPFNHLKNIDDSKENIVLLTTGAFSPIHLGHISMMQSAERKLIEKGYNVLGGYFSPCNYKYLIKKGNTRLPDNTRLNFLNEQLSSTHYKLDLWESLHLTDTVNFTEVINRLEQYLNKHVSKKIKVIYVYGLDNIDFSKCFDGIKPNVCVYRDTDSKFKNKINELKNSSTIFIKDNIYSGLASSKINVSNILDFKSFDVNKYLVRNEGVSPFKYLNIDVTDNQKIFKDNFIKLLNKFTRYDIDELNITEQINYANKILQDKNTISFDYFFKGNYNIEMSRLFELSDFQKNPDKIINSPNSQPLINQIKHIDTNKGYVVIDDDTVSGNTLNKIKKLLANIDIQSFYFLADYLNEEYFDVIDLRDFIIGAENGGLVVCLNNKNIRVPYIYPFVNLSTRASIDLDKSKEFSKNVVNLNIEFYKKSQIKVSEIKHNELWNYLGYADYFVEDMLLDILKSL